MESKFGSDSGDHKTAVTGDHTRAAASPVSVVLLGADEARRKDLARMLAGTAAHVIREAAHAPSGAMPQLLEGSDVLIVILADNPEEDLKLLEAACAVAPAVTVMAYARTAEPGLLMRCMQSGAREFLSDPLSQHALQEAVIRAAIRREEIKRHGKTGKCLVFVGAKGGSGVTTLAANFAIALAKESGQSVALLDLDIRMGDAALNLGIANEFSTLDALRNADRLDSELISKYLVTHESGLHVLGAPDDYNASQPSPVAVLRLVELLMRDFDWLVVDAGTHENGFGPQLFDIAEKVYLVAQVSVPELRNSNRFITTLFQGSNSSKLDVVLNRCCPRYDEISDDSVVKALTVSPAWKVPNDFEAVRVAQNTATALALKDNPIARVLTRMARAACGKPAEELTKRRFGLFQ